MSAFKLDFSNSKNRLIRASTKIRPYSLVMETKSLFHTVLMKHTPKFCEDCLSDKKDLLKCGGCQQIFYCNSECQKSDWVDSHKKTCKIYKMLKLKGFTPTTFFKLLIKIGFSDNKERLGLLKDFQDNSSDFDRSKIDFIEETCKMIEVYANIQKLELKISYEDMVKLGCKIQINSFTIQQQKTGTEIGIGLFHPANFINHCCEPNAIQVFTGCNLRIVSIREINENEEINICYAESGEGCRKFLKENYFFNCDCGYCKEKVEDVKLKESLEQLNSISDVEQKYVDIMKVIEIYGIKHLNLKEILERFIFETIAKEKFRISFRLVKFYIKNWNFWFKHKTPDLGWKYAEACKLASYLNKNKSVYSYGTEAIKILEKFYKRNEGLEEIYFLIEKNQIKMF